LITGRGAPLIKKDNLVLETEIVEGIGVSKTRKSRKNKKTGGVNNDLLFDILKAVETTIADHIDNISVKKKAKAISLLYGYFTDTGKAVDEHIVLNFLELGES
jgi:hypothetical protein